VYGQTGGVRLKLHRCGRRRSAQGVHSTETRSGEVEILEPKSSDIVKGDGNGGTSATDSQYSALTGREWEIVRRDSSKRSWDSNSPSTYLSELRLNYLEPIVKRLHVAGICIRPRGKRGEEGKNIHLLCSGSGVLTALNGIPLYARAAGISPVAL
jgi:hypothetical protein